MLSPSIRERRCADFDGQQLEVRQAMRWQSQVSAPANGLSGEVVPWFGSHMRLHSARTAAHDGHERMHHANSSLLPAATCWLDLEVRAAAMSLASLDAGSSDVARASRLGRLNMAWHRSVAPSRRHLRRSVDVDVEHLVVHNEGSTWKASCHGPVM